jgi:para-aminobenzoate synthetase component 2
MSLQHRDLAVEGVQFHPESVLTQAGHLMLANWLAACGDPRALGLAPALVEQTEARRLSAYA